MSIFKEIGAWWSFDYNSRFSPHAILTSGYHSDEYFNSIPIFSRPGLLEEAAFDLIQRGSLLLDNDSVNLVVGIQTGGELLGNEIARKLRVPFFGVKILRGDDKGIAVSSDLIGKKRALLVDDVVSTFSTIQFVDSRLSMLGVEWYKTIVALVNRSGESCFMGKNISALISKKTNKWVEGDCPLCKAGSPAFSVKRFWELFNGS